MASIRISQLASVSAVTADDYLIINDSDVNTRKISYGDFALGLIQSNSVSQTLTGSLTVTGALSPLSLAVDTDTFVVNSTTDKVGIKVAGPAYALDVNGDIQVRNGNTLRFADSTTAFAVTLQAPGTLTANSSYTLPTRQPTANGMALVSTIAGAMDWATVLTDPMTTVGDMVIRNSANATSRLAIGTVGHVLTVASGGVPYWTASASGFADPMTSAGDMIIKNAVGTTTRIGVGSNGQILGVSGGIPAWQTDTFVPGGSNTQVQFNNGGLFSGSSALTWDGTTLAAGNLTTANLTANGNTIIGDLNTADTVTITARVASNVVPTTNNTYSLGGPSLKWNNAYINLLNAGGLVYPTADGTSGQVLTTDGSGTLTFTTVSGGGGGVTSVNGDTGVVTVTPASISALALAGGTMTGNITFAAGQPTGTSATPGILSLIDNVDSSDQTVAGSAKAVKTAYDRGETGVTNAAAAQATADAALPLVGGTMTGNITFNGSQAFPAPLPGGSTAQVQFNNAGALDGSANLVLNGTVTTATALVAGGLTYPTADGTSGQVISTNGSGVLTFTTVSGGGGSPAGLDTQVQFNDGGSFGANANLVFNDTTNTLGVTAISALNITAAGTLNVLGGVTLGDANTDTITFTGRANSNLVPLTNNSVDLGGPSLKWNNAYINLLNAGGLVYPTADGAAGTVLTSDGSGTLSLAAIPTQTLAAVTGAGATTTTNISVGSLLTVQGDGASADGAIKLNCSQNSHGVTIQAPPHSAAATYTLTLPNNTGTNGQVLTTDGTGVLSFTTSASAPVTSVNTLTGAVVLTATDVSALSLSGGTLLGDLTMSGSNVIAFNATQTFPAPLPAGATTQVQFNNAGVLAGDAGLTYNATTDTLTTVNVAATDVTTATLTASGNAVLGDALTDTIALNGVVTTDIVPNADDTRLLGSSTARWSQLWISDGIEFSADAADEARITPLATGLQGLKIGNVEIHAGTSANTNDESVFIGQGAGSTSSESRGVVVIGAQAGQNMVSGASNSVLIGYRAGKNINQSSNVVIGASAGFGTPTGTGQTDNVLVGYAAAIDLTEGNHNVAVGAQDLFRLVTGKGNVSIGFGSSSSIPNAGGGNVFIGAYNSAGTFSPTHSPGTGSVSNTVVMGSSGVTNAYIQVAWTAVSDARDKVVMGSVPHGLDFVSKLKPVTYQFKRNADRNEHNGNGQDRYGFLAQDVLALEGDRPVIIDNIDEDKLKLTSDAIIPVLVNAIKELKAEIEKLKNA